MDRHNCIPLINFPLAQVDAVTTSQLRRGCQGYPVLASSTGLTEKSVFHESWWLDIATSGQWDSVRVLNGSEVIGEMPYALTKKGIWRVSTLPPLTRSLGPIVYPGKDPANHDWRYRRSVVDNLIVQLPECARIHQILDWRITDALAFSARGFAVSVHFTIQIPPVISEREVWNSMRPNTRNLIRRAAENLTVAAILDIEEFVRFYDVNLQGRQSGNMYGRVMRKLVEEFIRRDTGLLLGAYDQHRSLAAAIALVWDQSTMYYLLSSRSAQAHHGAVSLLLWAAIKVAREGTLVFDFDGIGTPGILRFLSGFGGRLGQRFEVERLRMDYAVVRTMRRAVKAACRGVYKSSRWPLES